MQAESRDLGKNYHPYEGAYLSQVNSIQRHVARDLGIPLVDYETILQQVRMCGAHAACQPLRLENNFWPGLHTTRVCSGFHQVTMLRMSCIVQRHKPDEHRLSSCSQS